MCWLISLGSMPASRASQTWWATLTADSVRAEADALLGQHAEELVVGGLGMSGARGEAGLRRRAFPRRSPTGWRTW
jgi:hypothetical protein